MHAEPKQFADVSGRYSPFGPHCISGSLLAVPVPALSLTSTRAIGHHFVFASASVIRISLSWYKAAVNK